MEKQFQIYQWDGNIASCIHDGSLVAPTLDDAKYFCYKLGYRKEWKTKPTLKHYLEILYAKELIGPEIYFTQK